MPTALVTGFPGFIGRRLVRTLLDQHADLRIVALVEGRMAAVARQITAGEERVEIVPGDIAERRLGLSDADWARLTGEVTHVFHLAAIYDLAVPVELAERVNIEGTGNVLELCLEARDLQRHVYVSTAYVAGKRHGIVYEHELVMGQQFKNHYESTKFQAEVWVHETRERVPTTIVRPAVVVGDSRTGETEKFDGPYYLLRTISRMARAHRAVVQFGASDATFNVVPVDFVVAAIAAVAFDDAATGETLHLVDPEPLTTRELVTTLSQVYAGRPPAGRISPALVETSLRMKPVRELFGGTPRESIEYLNHAVTFDTRRAVDLLTPHGLRPPRFPSTSRRWSGSSANTRRTPRSNPGPRADRQIAVRRALEPMMPHMRLPMAAVAVAAVLLIPAAGASGAGLSFTAPAQLPHGDPKGSPAYGGGEPSLAFDPTGDGHLYVTAPQGIPAAAGEALGGNPAGIAYWASDDAGHTFPRSGITGSGTGGGDSDVEVLGDHKVLAADLEATATAICSSTDFAKTFPDCTGGVAPNQQGPENDREWLTRGAKPGEVYLTYHDFAGGFPIIEKSTDGGQTFSPCGTIIDPAGPAAQNYTPAGGTLVSKPSVGPDGSIYVEFTTPDQNAPPVGAKLNHLYMAVAKGGCTATTVFTDHVIYQDPGADLARIFQASARDGGGNLYVLTGGQTKAGQTDSGLYLFTSTDDGTTWSAPAKVNPPALKANVFPAIAGGPAKGEVVFGWFGTETSGDPNTQTNQWRFYGGESLDGGQTIATTTVSPDPLHYGDICTQGVFCGLVPGQPGNRNLADFASVAVNPADGCPAFAIPGDPYNRPDQPNGDNTFGSSAYVSLADGTGPCFTAAKAGQGAGSLGSGSGSGGSACLDRAAPAVRVRSAKHPGRRLTLRGTSSDRGCGAGGKGKVARVQVAIAKRTGKQCRFVTSKGRLAGAGSCAKPRLLTAKGTSAWRLRVARKLSKGRYVVLVRGRDKAGNTGKAHAARTVRLK